MIKAVAIGFSHMHVNEVAKYIYEQPEFEFLGIGKAPCDAPEIPDYPYTEGWSRNNVKEKYCANYYDDYISMLDELKPDIAFVFAEYLRIPEVVAECAKRGINVAIEKPMAGTYEDALKIKEAADKYGIEVMVNWPLLWRPYVRKFLNAVEKRIVGEPLKLRYINGHAGPYGAGTKHRGVDLDAGGIPDAMRAKTHWHIKELCGGARLDICCYGCLYSELIFGDDVSGVLAHSVNMNTPFGNTEDDVTVIVKYGETKLSVFEGTWATPRLIIPSGPTLICDGGAVYCVNTAEKNPDVKACDMTGREIEVPDIEAEDKYKNLPWHYVHHVKYGEPIHPMLSLEVNLNVIKMLDEIKKSIEAN